MLDLGECQSLDADNLPSASYLSPVQTSTQSNNCCFMFVGFGVNLDQFFGCTCPKHKCSTSSQNSLESPSSPSQDSMTPKIQLQDYKYSCTVQDIHFKVCNVRLYCTRFIEQSELCKYINTVCWWWIVKHVLSTVNSEKCLFATFCLANHHCVTVTRWSFNDTLPLLTPVSTQNKFIIGKCQF